MFIQLLILLGLVNMIDKKYSKNYIKIYFWKSLTITSGLLSLFIVIPFLSKDQELFGIYTFCIAFTLYLTYADIGFLAAGQKYAAEQFVKGNRNEEMGILGFTGIILILMFLPFSIAMIYFSIHPNMILNNLTLEGQNIASNIFLISGIIIPFQIILQRLTQSILAIRIKDFISLRIDFVFNLLKIASVFYFFSNDKYLIVEYFLFISSVTIFSSLIIMIIIKKIENYDFLAFFKCIKLSNKYFLLTKKLALSSLFLTVSWIIFYELDVIFIGKLFGPKEIALYAIGFTFLNFLRSLWQAVFSPFSQRFNHFTNSDSAHKLKKLASNLTEHTLPLCIVVTVVLILATKYIVVFWVGEEYLESIKLMQILILGTGFSFVIQPAMFYFTSQTKYYYLNLLAIALPTTFLIIALIFVPRIGIIGFAIGKTASMLMTFLISLYGISKLINSYKIFRNWSLQLLIFGFISCYVFPQIFSIFFIELHKSTLNLFLCMMIIAFFIFLSLIMIYGSKKYYRQIAFLFLNKIVNNKIKP